LLPSFLKSLSPESGFTAANLSSLARKFHFDV
jgi:hypothetical protein